MFTALYSQEACFLMSSYCNNGWCANWWENQELHQLWTSSASCSELDNFSKQRNQLVRWRRRVMAHTCTTASSSFDIHLVRHLPWWNEVHLHGQKKIGEKLELFQWPGIPELHTHSQIKTTGYMVHSCLTWLIDADWSMHTSHCTLFKALFPLCMLSSCMWEVRDHRWRLQSQSILLVIKTH